MKYLVLLMFSCSLVFGGKHKLILQFDTPIDPSAAFSGLDVMSWRQLNNSTTYKVVIQSNLTRSEVRNQIYQNINLTNDETDQTTTLGALESAGSIDSRLITIVDEVYDYGTYTSDSSSVNSRLITIVDGGAAEYDALYSQYHVTETKAQVAWDYTTGRGVTVAVLDTGVDLTHPFLVDNLVAGYDFVDEDSVPDEVRDGVDSNNNGITDEGWGHGTHVAGIVKTIAPGASIMPVRVADSDGQVELFDIIQGMEFAIRNGADVINLSMSIAQHSPQLEYWMQVAQAYNIVVVTSAGNDNSTDIMYPASEVEVITVTSLGPDRTKSSFANFGTEVDIAAPGERIVSCAPGGAYVSRSGTSMAAPIVSAQVAIILELVPGQTVNYVRNRVRGFCQDIKYYNPGYNNKLGRGLVDIWDSITVQHLN